MFGIKPASIYNGMIAPLGSLAIKGVLWYQGESNSAHPETYPALLATLVSEWRGQFRQPNLPFLIVQLPDYVNPWEGFYWPWIRERQAEAVETIPNTALVVSLGTTDGFDLHPKEKLEISRRASLLARQLAYGERLVASGPTFESAAVEGSSIRVHFRTPGDGLASTALDGVHGFALAGADGEYRLATARIQGDSVVVHSKTVPQPQTVRYAWAGAPDASLVNRSDLPAAPFRTDTLPCSNVEVQKQLASRRVATTNYEVVIGANGMATSLVVHGAQFLSNEAGAAGGTCIPGFWGPRTLADICELGPRLLTCQGEEVGLQMQFAETSLCWTITNHAKEALSFRMNLSPQVRSPALNEGRALLTRGKVSLSVDGVDAVTNTPVGAVLVSRIQPGATRMLSLNFAPAAPPKQEQARTLAQSQPVRLVSIQADPVYKEMLGLRTNGWLGSDDGESIVLSEQKSLWLFGDTFIGPLSNGVRVVGAPMINSTIALQDRAQAPPDCLTFYWKEKNGKPASFFPHQAGTPGDYYWVTKGALLNGELFLFAWCISGTAEGLLGWKEAGSALIRIPNPLDPPDQWVQKAYPLKLPEGVTFHSALLVQPPFLYLYGIAQPRQTALARIRIDDLVQGKLTDAYEYWVQGPQGPQWSREAKHCVPQFQPVNSECSVQYEPGWKLYTCFTYDVMNPEIFLTTAPAPTGPWSEPVTVYHFPEASKYSFPIMCYAVRQHPELSTRPGEVVLTYATNIANSEKELFTPEGKDVYVHRFLRAQLELNPNHKHDAAAR